MGKIFSRSPSSVSSLTKAKRSVALGLKRSPLLSWMYHTRDVHQLLLIPRDLRTADPSLSIELDMGQFGLAGATVLLESRSPFHVDPPNLAWSKELHSFSWVRNLRAARSERSMTQAQELTEHWLNSFKTQKGLPWEPEIAARRLISWLSYSDFLLHEVSEDNYLAMLGSIDDHMRYLSMSGSHAEPGMPRLLSLISLVFAGLCVAKQEKFTDQQVKFLCAELDRQILPDGGHISRDNSLLASLLLDLLPLKQCFVSRNLVPPGPILSAIKRMLPMIHYMRLGDGLLSRFNGSGTTLPDTLSTAMAYDDFSTKALIKADQSKYYRLEEGNVIVLMDGGSAPDLSLSQKSHAGCLSFEMSSGTCPMIVNCGAAPPAYHTMAQNARATVSHSTLTINNRSSAQFLHDKTLASPDIPSLLSGPPFAQASYETTGEENKIVGSHDGYRSQFGLVHHRLLSLSKDGYSLTGEDWIEVPDQSDTMQMGLGWPYAVHFHIHPDVETSRSSDGKAIFLTLPDSQVWKLSAAGQIVHLEESRFYADFAGPCLSVQAVIRGNCVGQTSIPWKLVKSIEVQVPDVKKIPAWLAGNVIPLGSALEVLDTGETDEPLAEQPTKKNVKDEKTAPSKVDKSADDGITDLVEDNLTSSKKAPPKRAPKKPTVKGGAAKKSIERKETPKSDKQPPKLPPRKDEKLDAIKAGSSTKKTADQKSIKPKKTSGYKPFGFDAQPVPETGTATPPPLPKDGPAAKKPGEIKKEVSSKDTLAKDRNTKESGTKDSKPLESRETVSKDDKNPAKDKSRLITEVKSVEKKNEESKTSAEKSPPPPPPALAPTSPKSKPPTPPAGPLTSSKSQPPAPPKSPPVPPPPLPSKNKKSDVSEEDKE